MELSAIIGKLLSGAACTLYAGAMGIWVAIEAITPLQHVSDVVTRLP